MRINTWQYQNKARHGQARDKINLRYLAQEEKQTNIETCTIRWCHLQAAYSHMQLCVVTPTANTPALYKQHIGCTKQLSSTSHIFSQHTHHTLANLVSSYRTARTTSLQMNLGRYTSSEEEKACHKLQFISGPTRTRYQAPECNR
jgi:hypothetical protein